MSAINKEVYNTVLALLTDDKDGSLKRILESIVCWERNNPPRSEYDGFEWYMVYADPRTLNSLVTKRVLKIVFKSNKSCIYRAIDVNAIEKALKDYEGMFIEEEVEGTIPPDLFNIIIGHEDKKELIMRGLKSEKPVHFLLYGVPASAKSLMLEELERLPKSKLILGSNLTKAGLFDILFNERPKYLIIDELDKVVDVEALAALLSLMERGRVTETKYRRHRTIRLKTWVFAACNSITRIPLELLSRFTILKFREYSEDEFYEVAVNVLKIKEDIPDGLAIYIAQKTLMELKSKDVRDCIKVARMLMKKTREDVDRVISLMKKQRVLI